jgi:hypothetical protein
MAQSASAPFTVVLNWQTILKKRVPACGGKHSRKTAIGVAGQIRKLHRSDRSKSEISRRLNIGRTSVCRILTAQPKLKLTCLPPFCSTAGTHGNAAHDYSWAAMASDY